MTDVEYYTSELEMVKKKNKNTGYNLSASQSETIHDPGRQDWKKRTYPENDSKCSHRKVVRKLYATRKQMETLPC